MLETLVFEIQRLYPQIYIACHVDHVRPSSTKWNLSSYDASILAHLKLDEGMSPRALAGHLGIVPSTLSAALERLERLGYIKNVPNEADRRKREIWLTGPAAEAMAATSVLDGARIERLLERLSPEERELAVGGLALLARAASEMKKEEGE